MVPLKVCDGLDIIDHVSTAGQGDGKRLRHGIAGHVDTLPRLSSGSTLTMSAKENEAKNTLYVVEAKICLGHGVVKSMIVLCLQMFQKKTEHLDTFAVAGRAYL